MLGPVAAGLVGTLMPALGHLPAAGIEGWSLAPWRDLLAWPGLPQATRLSVVTGLAATIGALSITMLIAAGWSGTRPFRALERLLSPLLSVPHAAAAFGIAFLIAPSGWIARALATPLGLERPPDLLIVGDPWGLGLTLGLIAKEVPFLLLMTIAALGQVPARQRLTVAQALGYGRVRGWMLCVFPAVYAQIRLPVYVVLAYSMSVVDVALILGPSTPPTLSVQVVRWMADPDLTLRTTAAAGALMQLGLVAAALLAWRGAERIVARLGTAIAARGLRGALDWPTRAVGLIGGTVAAASVLAGIAGLAIWSVAGRWSFPSPLPDALTARSWQRHLPDATAAAADTAIIAAIAVAIALMLAIGCLEAEHRHRQPMTRRAIWLLYLPILMPQVAFLPGLQTLLLSVGLDRGLGPVIAAHLVFVLPYVFLSLSDPWRAWDSRQATAAAALGAAPGRVLWTVRLPMMLRPLLVAAAIGIAVSVGQYLPTLLIGGGRVATLTTEAVALASGGDRRAIGVWALLQTGAALAPFALALAVPALIWRNRRGLHG
ncbi:MAG: ABC transporter permease [Paracoccaceae bacterium]